MKDNTEIENPYLKSIHAALPRLLAQFDTNAAGITHGVGDRFYWAWSLIDFANATMQGAVNGLARLIHYNLLPAYIDESAIVERIDGIILGTRPLIKKNGSVDQAFPFEGSYCGTALVAYDFLNCIELLNSRLSDEALQNYLSLIEPMMRFLHLSDETHGFISNHLAVVAAALFKWSKLTGNSGFEKGKSILNRILDHQSKEGWYKEYDGADPGYQSLCTGYLADIDYMHPELGLRPSIFKSFEFIKHFAHPDGSFGGVYGCRNTRFYYPAGFEYYTHLSQSAFALTVHMRRSVSQMLCPGLESMDAPNMAPMFNSYCWAAALFENQAQTQAKEKTCLPCFSERPFTQYWPEAGLFVRRGEADYTVISTHKGGVVYHFSNNVLKSLDTGILLKEDRQKKRFTNQIHQTDNHVKITDKQIEIQAKIKPVRCLSPSPFQFGILRFLNVSIMRVPFFREFIKKMLAYLLITAKGKSMGVNIRTIELSEQLSIKDHLETSKALSQMDVKHPFTAIHMASQGYWQKQDDQAS
tara:strand:- start:546 stop:2126 length:1581 start_codon:yes stop_codon:yes gene_type:complete